MNTTEERPQSPEEATSYFYPVIAPLMMCEGVGDGRNTACIMAQAATIDALRKGRTLDKPTDEMECCCPILRRLAIRANDTSWWESNEERTEHLRPLIPLLLDSRGDKALMDQRASLIADNVVRVLTPMRLEWIAENTKSDKLKGDCAAGAKALRELPQIKDKESALSASGVCRKFKDDAYADAAESAYASAYADAYADRIGAQKVKYRTAYLEMFRACAAIK
jgi:hypothetical protein